MMIMVENWEKKIVFKNNKYKRKWHFFLKKTKNQTNIQNANWYLKNYIFACKFQKGSQFEK